MKRDDTSGNTTFQGRASMLTTWPGFGEAPTVQGLKQEKV